MKKRKVGRTLSRTKSQRTALKRTLLVSLTKYGRIKTTLAKAKELRPFAERMITRAKKATDKRKEIAVMRLLKKDVTAQTAGKLIELAKAFNGRKGGYVRIVKFPFRKSDGADMALVEWTVEAKKGEKVEKRREGAKAEKEPKGNKE